MTLKTLLPTLSLAAGAAMAQGTPIDRANMDLDVAPGTDFFEYAGGGWRKAHPLTPEFTRYGQFNYLVEENQKQLRGLIEGLAATPQPQGTLSQKIGSLYNLAMDSVRLNREGCQPVKPWLARVEAVTNRDEFQLLCAELSHRGVASLMFGVGVDADLRDASSNLVQIWQGGLTMGNRDYYLETDEHTAKIRAAYKDYVRRLFLLAGYDAAAAEKAVQAVLSIETALARESYSATKLRDVEANFHKMPYAQLLTDYPGVNWDATLRALGYPSISEVSVGQPEPIKEAGKLLVEMPLDDLKAYAEFKILTDAASALSDDFRAADFDFFSHTMNGAEQDRPRWKRAVSTVNGVLGMAVGKMYVEKYFPASSKQRMLQLVADLQQALGERIAAAKWMGAETKRQAQDKLAHFIVKIGYPDKWRSYDGLTIDDSLSYYENLARAGAFLQDDEIARKVNKPVDKSEWLMTPQTVNAYYNPTTNEICFPAAILQHPFFNPNADDAANYGAIGVVIGHEMTHGFDDQGSQFDKDGNLRDWWTADDKKNFRKRTQVMADFFDHIEVLPGMYANGKLTLGENIADNGGINVAYTAFRHALERHPLGIVDGFTPEQRFFLSFGLIWAENIRDEQLRAYNKIDPHSPARWRVNGALPHIDAWYDAFHITRKDALFLPKKKRVDVW